MIFLSILGFAAVVFFGYLIINLCIPKNSFLEKISLGYLVGFGFFTFALFLTSLYGVRYGLRESGGALLLLVTVSYLLNKLLKRDPSFCFKFKIDFNKIVYNFKKLSTLGKISLIWLTIISLSILIYDLYWPLRGTDAFALYDFRAISFVTTGAMDDAISRGYFIGYPLFTTLSHTWFYLTGFTSPMFFYAFFYIAFIVLFYLSLRKLLTCDSSLIFTAVMASFPDIYGQAQLAYTNLPYTVFLVLGSIYLYLGIKSEKKGYLFVSMFLTMLSCWTRNIEPLWLINVIVIMIYGLIRRKNIIIAAVYTFIVNIFRLPWNYFYEANTDSVLNIKNQIAGGGKAITRGIINEINVGGFLHYFYFYAIRPYIVLYAILLILLLYKIIWKSKRWWFFLILTGYISLLFLSTYVFVLTNPKWQEVASSFQRLVIFLIPMMIFVIAIEFDKVAKNLKFNVQTKKKAQLSKI